MAQPYLSATDMRGGYGKADILNGCTLTVEKGQIAVIVGPNGAGKSTAMKAVFGMLNLREGAVLLDGQDITALTPQERVHKGMGFVPQTHNIFPTMTVEENLEMGAFLHTNKEENAALLKKVFQRFPRLEERKNQDAATLSGGEQQMLAMGRALMSRPKLLLLDEPSMGLAPIFIQEIFDIIEDIKAQGTTVLLIEQNANKALSIADRGYVLETGKVVLSGTGEELLASDEVRKAYLGG